MQCTENKKKVCSSYSRHGRCKWGRKCWFAHSSGNMMTLATQDDDSAHERGEEQTRDGHGSREYEESHRKRKCSSSPRAAVEAVVVEAAKALKRQRRFGLEPCPKKQDAPAWHSEERDVQRAVVIINPEEEGEEEAVEEEEEGELQDRRMTNISRKLCKILRHDAVKLGLRIQVDGFCELDEVLKLQEMRALRVSRTEVEHVNQWNNKKRFDMCSSLDGAKRFIRAVQGHSMQEVEDESGLHEKLSFISSDLPEQCVHGTYKGNVISILMGGLKRCTRNHIHFRAHHGGEWPTRESFSGMRRDKDTIFCIDLHKAMHAGIEFLRSKNGVILTRGEAGVLAPKYLSSLMYRGADEEFISLR